MKTTYLTHWFRSFACALILAVSVLMAPQLASADSPAAKMGIHIMHPRELDSALELLRSEDARREDAWVYVTVPVTLQDLESGQGEWETFFKQAEDKKVIPLVRLMTKFEDEAWQVPTKKNIVDQIAFLQQFEWPTDQKHIIIFNEVNHSGEWGGVIDPAEYARTLVFASQWARTEEDGFVVLPAAMDLATPNTGKSMEAFAYWNAALREEPELFSYIDAWNSHSYPNPAFSAPPTARGKNTLRGFEYELAYLADHDQQDLPVYITETGWRNTPALEWRLTQYYEYAMDHIWSNPQVKAVTPFVLSGDPGPFAEFAFLDREGKPTAQYLAFKNALRLDVIQ